MNSLLVDINTLSYLLFNQESDFWQIDGDADEDDVFCQLATVFDSKFVSADLGIVHFVSGKVENMASLGVSCSSFM